jgi:tRNA threonylcarbamoyladenosine biosynthesis protein TsaB
MLLLAVDTSGKNGSLALASATTGQSNVEIVGVVPLDGGAFSAQLVPQIAALLEKHEHSKNDLEAFAVASGPGSFTGLRVGLAAIKALGEVLQKPIVAISLLEAVAWRSQSHGAAHGLVLALLNAGRGDVYVGDYQLDAQLHMRSERLLSRDELVAEIAGMRATARIIVTPDAVLAENIRAAGIAPGIQIELVTPPDAAVIARLGWKHLQRGEKVPPEALEANYIRHSDAEIFSKPG